MISQSYDACKCNIINTTFSASFPWHFNEKIVTNYVLAPRFGSNQFQNNKIRICSQSLVAPLSSTERATLRSVESYANDTNKLGVYFSPVDVVNDDILKFFGNLNLSDIIGSPTNAYDRQYTELKSFIKTYFKYGSLNFDNIFYVNLVKSYFDKSIFKQIEKMSPDRCKLMTGLLVEPHVLERSKVKYNAPKISIKSNYKIDFDLKNNPQITIQPKLETNLAQNLGDNKNPIVINDKIYNTKNSSYVNNYFIMVEDDSDLFSLYTRDGIYQTFLLTTDGTYIPKYFVLELYNKEYNKTSYNGDGTYSISSKKVKSINKIPIISRKSINSVKLNYPDSTIFSGKSQNHYFNRRKLSYTVSIVQTINTTVDINSGLNDNSLPVIINKVDRGQIFTGTQNSGVILNVTS